MKRFGGKVQNGHDCQCKDGGRHLGNVSGNRDMALFCGAQLSKRDAPFLPTLVGGDFLGYQGERNYEAKP